MFPCGEAKEKSRYSFTGQKNGTNSPPTVKENAGELWRKRKPTQSVSGKEAGT